MTWIWNEAHGGLLKYSWLQAYWPYNNSLGYPFILQCFLNLLFYSGYLSITSKKKNLFNIKDTYYTTRRISVRICFRIKRLLSLPFISLSLLVLNWLFLVFPSIYSLLDIIITGNIIDSFWYFIKVNNICERILLKFSFLCNRYPLC